MNNSRAGLTDRLAKTETRVFTCFCLFWMLTLVLLSFHHLELAFWNHTHEILLNWITDTRGTCSLKANSRHISCYNLCWNHFVNTIPKHSEQQEHSTNFNTTNALGVLYTVYYMEDSSYWYLPDQTWRYRVHKSRLLYRRFMYSLYWRLPIT